MNNRDGQYSDPGDEFVLQNRSINIKAVGIGAVQDDYFFARRRACVHQVIHGDVKCVIAKAHILNINHQCVKAIHVSGRGICGSASEERDGRHAGLLIHRIQNLSPGIVLSPQPMLGHKYNSQIHFLPHKSIHDMLPIFHRAAVHGLSEGNQILSHCQGVGAGIFFIFQRVCSGIFYDMNRARVSAAGVRVLIFPGQFSLRVCVSLDLVSYDSCLICKKRDPLSVQHGQVDIRALIAEDDVRISVTSIYRFHSLRSFRRLLGRFCRLRSCNP